MSVRECNQLTCLLALAALIGAAGCARTDFQPRSSATGSPSQARLEVRTPGEAISDAPRHAGISPAQRAPETPAPVVSLADLDLPFVRASRVPGVNVFGEFDGQGEMPVTTVAGRAGFRQHTFVDEGFDADVVVSPDGQWMAFASTRHSPRSDIYLQRTGGMAVIKLTSDPADDAFPSFSPDGSRIAFCSNRSGSWDIYVMDADGKNITAVTQASSHDLAPSFSPCGNRLIFCRMGARSGQWELWIADLTSGQQTMVGFGLFPAWSPRQDKDVVAFQRARQRGGRWFSLWTLELVGGEPTALTEVAMSTNSALVAPSWSPDGQRIAFATVVDPEAGVADPAVGFQDIWTVNSDGSDRRRLTDGRGVYATPHWGQDGRIYFISDRSGTECIWSTRADGTNFSTAAVDVGP